MNSIGQSFETCNFRFLLNIPAVSSLLGCFSSKRSGLLRHNSKKGFKTNELIRQWFNTNSRATQPVKTFEQQLPQRTKQSSINTHLQQISCNKLLDLEA